MFGVWIQQVAFSHTILLISHRVFIFKWLHSKVTKQKRQKRLTPSDKSPADSKILWNWSYKSSRVIVDWPTGCSIVTMINDNIFWLKCVDAVGQISSGELVYICECDYVGLCDCVCVCVCVCAGCACTSPGKQFWLIQMADSWNVVRLFGNDAFTNGSSSGSL